MVEAIQPLHLEDARGAEDPRAVGVFTDRGDDKHKRPHAIAATPGHGMRARGKTRRVPSALRALTTPTSTPWGHMAPFLRHHRRRTWHTRRLTTHGTPRKRMAFRTRDTMGSLRSVGQVPLGCSEPRKRPDGRRTSFACHARSVPARQRMIGYRLRWAMELFHTTVKQHLGFEDVATSGLASVMSHVYWVYGADMVLAMAPPEAP